MSSIAPIVFHVSPLRSFTREYFILDTHFVVDEPIGRLRIAPFYRSFSGKHVTFVFSCSFQYQTLILKLQLYLKQIRLPLTYESLILIIELAVVEETLHDFSAPRWMMCFTCIFLSPSIFNIQVSYLERRCIYGRYTFAPNMKLGY